MVERLGYVRPHLFLEPKGRTDSLDLGSIGSRRLVDDDASYDELKAGLGDIEAVEEQLRQMLASASDASRRLRGKFIARANRACFRDLPDEIIAIILEMALDDTRSQWQLGETANSFGRVCRQWHRVVGSLPVFWSKISSPPFQLKKATLFASRAVAPTICLSIRGIFVSGFDTEASELKRVMGMYKLAVSVSARIQKLALHFYADDMPHLEQILETCANVSLPSLSELKLNCSSNEVGRKTRRLCQSWDMPSLQTLTLSDALPDLPFDVLLRIQTCSLEANRDYSQAELLMNGCWFTSEIVEFLASLLSVENLRVAVKTVGGFANADEDPVMDSVKSLDLGLQNGMVATSPSILHFIAFPSLTSFRIDLGLRDFNLLHEVLDNLNFIVPPTSVTNVTVAIGMEHEDADRGSPIYTIGEWCQQFGDVKSLKLESKRSNTHGLFAFASPFDALDIVDEEGSTLRGELVEDIPFVKAWRRPRRMAVINTKNEVKYDDK